MNNLFLIFVIINIQINLVCQKDKFGFDQSTAFGQKPFLDLKASGKLAYGHFPNFTIGKQFAQKVEKSAF